MTSNMCFADCPALATLLINSHGTISYPLSGSYDNNLDCQWSLQANVGEVGGAIMISTVGEVGEVI